MGCRGRRLWPRCRALFPHLQPVTQLQKFDSSGRYAATWIAEGQANPPATALHYFDAIPRAWGLAPTDRYPRQPVVGLEDGRARALAAYAARGASAAE